MPNDPVGAVWRRWEPHIHSPGTALNDDFGTTTLEEYLTAIESASPVVEVLGITDYLLVRRYDEVRAAKATGRLPRVGMIFCNIEVRLTIETKAAKGVNLHLLVSPDDHDHVAQAQRFLAGLQYHFAGDNYACTEADLTRLGRAHDPSIEDGEAALQARCEPVQGQLSLAAKALRGDGLGACQHPDRRCWQLK